MMSKVFQQHLRLMAKHNTKEHMKLLVKHNLVQYKMVKHSLVQYNFKHSWVQHNYEHKMEHNQHNLEHSLEQHSLQHMERHMMDNHIKDSILHLELRMMSMGVYSLNTFIYLLLSFDIFRFISNFATYCIINFNNINFIILLYLLNYNILLSS